MSMTRYIAGIDEAGYGPVVGPLVVGRAVFGVPEALVKVPLWNVLDSAVCRTLKEARKGRLAINDSKKLTTKAAGIKHLEMGCLAFAPSKEDNTWPARLDDWLRLLGSTTADRVDHLPWYAPTEAMTWQALPSSPVVDIEALRIARAMLQREMAQHQIACVEIGAAVVMEDRFNALVQKLRTKAAVSFTFVGKHLAHLWQNYAEAGIHVAVDRQGGRTRYLNLLMEMFPEADFTVAEETAQRAAYRMVQGQRQMTVSFLVKAEEQHLPVALASMASKYTRELMMDRLNQWFTQRIDGLKPTKGYAVDGGRFLDEVQPHTERLGIDLRLLKRMK